LAGWARLLAAMSLSGFSAAVADESPYKVASINQNKASLAGKTNKAAGRVGDPISISGVAVLSRDFGSATRIRC
jgi:hypothetical protein